MRRVVASVSLVALTVGLSCSVRPPLASADVVVAAPRVDEDVDPLLAAVERRLANYPTKLSRAQMHATAREIVGSSRRLGLDVDLVLAVIRIESYFNTFAVSHAGAIGLMQVMPATGRIVARQLGLPWYGQRTLLDPVMNVRIGTTYLAWMHSRYGRWDLALAAYNWGPGAIDQRLARGHAIPEEYVELVYTALALHSRSPQ